MLGHDFHELRERRAISLKVAAGATTSAATLSKFENGVGDIGIDRLVHCLDNMGSSLLEFASMSDPSTGNPQSFLHRAIAAYNVRNEAELQFLTAQQGAKYRENHRLVDFHDYVSAAGLYCDLVGENLLPAAQLHELCVELVGASSWGEGEITEFGNAVVLLDDECLYDVTLNLLVHLKDIQMHSSAFYQDAWSALLNALDAFILHDSTHADDLINRFDTYDIPEDVMLIKWRYQFLKTCRRAAVQPGADAVAQVNQQLDFLTLVGDKQLHAHYAQQARDILGEALMDAGGDDK